MDVKQPEKDRHRMSRVLFSVEADDWALFGKTAGRDRPKVLREFIRWYIRRADSKLPDRPPRT